MIKQVALIVAVLSAFTAKAQYTSEGENTSRFRPGTMWFYTGFSPAKTDKVRKYDRLIFDITYNDWNGDLKPFNNNWASIGLNTNLMFDIPLVAKNKVALGVGVSHQFTNVRFNANFVKNDSIGATYYAPKNPSDNYVKNVLGGNSFSVPVEIRFRNEGWRHFKLHVGGKVGYQLNLFTKTVSDGIDGKEIDKSYGFPDVNHLIYSAHVRMGLRNWALYASYNFNTIFSNPESVQLNAMQFGLSISLF